MKESLIEREEGDELYEKVVRTGGNRYVYYYHNVKIKGKVRNVCLGTDLGRAKKTLGKIMRQKLKTKRPISSIIGGYWKPRPRTA